MARIWHKGPPPHVGWWNASRSRNVIGWRWWDGKYWSAQAYPRDLEKWATFQALRKASPQSNIEWTDHYPENARVPRVAP